MTESGTTGSGLVATPMLRSGTAATPSVSRRQALKAGVTLAAWTVPTVSAVVLTSATAQAASPMPNPGGGTRPTPATGSPSTHPTTGGSDPSDPATDPGDPTTDPGEPTGPTTSGSPLTPADTDPTPTPGTATPGTATTGSSTAGSSTAGTATGVGDGSGGGGGTASGGTGGPGTIASVAGGTSTTGSSTGGVAAAASSSPGFAAAPVVRTPAGDALAFTGSSALLPTLAGATLVAGGAAVIGATRAMRKADGGDGSVADLDDLD